MIDTKIKVTPADGTRGSLKAAKIRDSLAESFEARAVEQVGSLDGGSMW